MADIINLNKARKAKQRAKDQAQAAENRVKFGRTGAQKAADRAAQKEAEQRMQGLQLGPGSPEKKTDDGQTPDAG